MAAMVEMWMNELGKLGEKVGAARKRPVMVLTKAKGQEQVTKVEREDHKEEKEEKEVVAVRKEKDSSGLTEETIFLLMDRFAPL